MLRSNIPAKACWAIYCWRCNSAYDPNCADPFNNITSDLVNCDMRVKEHLPTVYSDYRTVRDCGWLKSDKEGTECMRRAGTFSVLMKNCSCDKDGCNCARRPTAVSSLLMVAPPLLLLRLFKWSTMAPHRDVPRSGRARTSP
ncbi:hypothetical protein MRX96_016987 [Rhipicephalus microplus]